MANTLVRVFERFSDAQNARNELLTCGFPPSDVQLTTNEDEAGPVQGNFTVGDATDGSSNSDKTSYERKYGNVVQRGVYMLTVDANEEDQLVRASDIMSRYGASSI